MKTIEKVPEWFTDLYIDLGYVVSVQQTIKVI
jgi:hypothetical protein